MSASFRIALSLGGSWHHASASGARPTGTFTRPADTYACSGSEGPGFAIGGGVGFDADLARDVAFILQADANAFRHTSDKLEGCAPGSGSVTALAARVGFAYRFDLEGGPRSSGPKKKEPVRSHGNSALLR